MVTDYSTEYENSVIEAYIETFADEPWNEVWEYDWVLKRLRWVESVPNFIGKIVLDGDKVIGALLGYAKPFRGRLDFEILELFVLPDFQGKGLGRKLVEELEQSLTSDEHGVVHLLTSRDSSSEKFYEKLNYERNDRLCFMVHRL